MSEWFVGMVLSGDKPWLEMHKMKAGVLRPASYLKFINYAPPVKIKAKIMNCENAGIFNGFEIYSTNNRIN